MKMAELSATTGVPVATIKYYLREGFLRPGTLTSPNQAQYDGEHVRRIRLIRSLLDVGGMSVAGAGKVLAAIDSDVSLAETFAVAQHTLSEDLDEADIDPEALAAIDEATRGWNFHPDNPGRLAAAKVLSSFYGIGQKDSRDWFARYARAALLAAEADLDEVETREDRTAMAETMVVGTVLGDALFAALRRVAQEHVTSQRYGSNAPKGSAG
jgi:DNA-binding transcriptional MerR regulator